MSTSKTAIITGGGGGLGRATALKLAESGVNISIIDVSEEQGNETVRLIEEKGAKGFFIKADVTNAEEVKQYVDKTVSTFGSVDMFFNNAGISGPGKKFLDNSIEQIDLVLDINLRGALYGLYYVLPEMIKNGGGSIVNTSSTAGLVGQDSVVSYSATKHGIVGVTKSLAAEYANQGIQINAVAPGSTETPMVKQYREMNPDVFKAVSATIPQRRLGQPEEVAELVSFLLMSEAKYINGAVVPIDGGFTAI